MGRKATTWVEPLDVQADSQVHISQDNTTRDADGIELALQCVVYPEAFQAGLMGILEILCDDIMEGFENGTATAEIK